MKYKLSIVFENYPDEKGFFGEFGERISRRA